MNKPLPNLPENILVTGGNGLVGKAIQEAIQEEIYAKNANFIFLSRSDGDLRIKSDTEQIFEKYKPSIVIHLASLVAGLYGNMNNNYTFLVDNIKINTNVLECCDKFKVSRLLNILSTCIFPNENIIYPLTSDQILNGKPHDSNSGYAYSKRLLYIGSELLSKKSNITVINLIPTNLFGKHDNYSLSNSHVIPGLIHKIYMAKKNDTALLIKGTGSAKRQFLYANDFAKIILHMTFCHLYNNFNALVVSPPIQEEIIIKKLIEQLVSIFDKVYPTEAFCKVVYDTYFSDGQIIKTTSNIELLKFIPDFKFTKLDVALKDTITHFVDNYDNVRK